MATVAKGRETVQDNQFVGSREARVRVNYGQALRNPSVVACLSETNAGPWGYFLYCSAVDGNGFTLVIRVPTNEGGVTPHAPPLIVVVDWIAVGD